MSSLNLENKLLSLDNISISNGNIDGIVSESEEIENVFMCELCEILKILSVSKNEFSFEFYFYINSGVTQFKEFKDIYIFDSIDKNVLNRVYSDQVFVKLIKITLKLFE